MRSRRRTTVRIRWLRSSRGTVAERRRGTLRFLAVAGACNAAMLLVYIVPVQALAVTTGHWPHDVVTRSYLTDGICGPGTPDACP